MHSLYHNFPKYIIDTICIPSKICAFDACYGRLDNNIICPVLVADMVLLLGNWTLVPLGISAI